MITILTIAILTIPRLVGGHTPGNTQAVCLDTHKLSVCWTHMHLLELQCMAAVVLQNVPTVFEYCGMSLFARTAKYGSDIAAGNPDNSQQYLKPMLWLGLRLKLGLELKLMLS